MATFKTSDGGWYDETKVAGATVKIKCEPKSTMRRMAGYKFTREACKINPADHESALQIALFKAKRKKMIVRVVSDTNTPGTMYRLTEATDEHPKEGFYDVHPDGSLWERVLK